MNFLPDKNNLQRKFRKSENERCNKVLKSRSRSRTSYLNQLILSHFPFTVTEFPMSRDHFVKHRIEQLELGNKEASENALFLACELTISVPAVSQSSCVRLVISENRWVDG